MSSSKQQGDAGTAGAPDAIDVDALMQANIVRVSVKISKTSQHVLPRGCRINF
jgi:hypothetical protein